MARTPETAASAKGARSNGAPLGFEAKLWAAADAANHHDAFAILGLAFGKQAVAAGEGRLRLDFRIEPVKLMVLTHVRNVLEGHRVLVMRRSR